MCTMEEDMMNKKHTCSPATKTTKTLSMQRDSHMISKNKPKIRIIHIFAPEIIKTDVANFRELVQRLTGKPTEPKKPKPRKVQASKRSSLSQQPTATKKMDINTRLRPSSDSSEEEEMMVREKIKGEDEIWVGANSGGGFLGGFADMDGFMQELNHHGFSAMLPNLDPPTMVNSHLDFPYGERNLNLPTYS